MISLCCAVAALAFIVVSAIAFVSIRNKSGNGGLFPCIRMFFMHVTKYTGITCCMFFILIISYGQIKGFFANALPSHSFENMRAFFKLIFRSEPVLSFMEAMMFYSLFISLCSCLGFVVVRTAEIFVEKQAKIRDGKKNIKLCALAHEREISLKNFLIYSRYNS